MFVCVCWCSQVMMHLLQPDFYWVSTIVWIHITSHSSSQTVPTLRRTPTFGKYDLHRPSTHVLVDIKRRQTEICRTRYVCTSVSRIWSEPCRNLIFHCHSEMTILRRSFMLVSVYSRRYTHFQVLWTFMNFLKI